MVHKLWTVFLCFENISPLMILRLACFCRLFICYAAIKFHDHKTGRISRVAQVILTVTSPRKN